MTILFRYIVSSVLFYFFLIQAVVLGIYLTVDFVEKLDDFLQVSLSLKMILLFFLCKIPLIFLQITPIGLLLAIIIVFASMRKNKELIALESSGIGVRIFMKIVIFVGIMGSLIVVIFSELIIPSFSTKANEIWFYNVEEKNVAISKTNEIWLKLDKQVVHIRHYFPNENKAIGFVVNYFDKSFRLVRRLNSKMGIFCKNKCYLYDVIEQKISYSNSESKVEVIFHDIFTLHVEFDPSDLDKIAKSSDEMSIAELRRHAQKVESDGYDGTRCWVDYYARISSYILCILFSLLSISITFSGKKLRKNALINVIYGIVIVFIYWFFNSFCISLGYAGVIYPVLSAWIANLMLFSVCLVKLLKISRL